jgi:hypothetical protein
LIIISVPWTAPYAAGGLEAVIMGWRDLSVGRPGRRFHDHCFGTEGRAMCGCRARVGDHGAL